MEVYYNMGTFLILLGLRHWGLKLKVIVCIGLNNSGFWIFRSSFD